MQIALALCERGKWREASQALADCEPSTEKELIKGCVLALTKPDEAKDVLSKAIRSLSPGELRDKGNIWLACCYWSAGEAEEARAINDSIEPSSDAVRFLLGLNASIFEPVKLKASLASLSSIEGLVDSVPELWKGKFFGQRGWLMRRLKQSDAAILDYESASYWYEQAEAPRYLAAAANNLAGLLIDKKRFDDAHRKIDAAIRALPEWDTLYLAQIYDQKARAFLGEQKYAEAAEYATRSVSLLAETENRSILAESLITRSSALKHLERHMEALNELERARAIAKYLGDKTILLNAVKEQKEVAQAFTQKTHIELVQTALDVAGNSPHVAARLLGIKKQPLYRFIRLHGIKRHPKVRKSVITKPRK